MKRFLDFLINEEARALHVYDIDDTLVHPTAKINVKNKEGEVVKTLVGAMPKPKLVKELEPFLG